MENATATTTQATGKTVGKFTLSNGSISGPADFMRAEGSAVIAAISAGELTEAFRRIMQGTADANPGLSSTAQVELAILLYLQTKYAGWVGYRATFGARG